MLKSKNIRAAYQALQSGAGAWYGEEYIIC